MVTRAYGGCEDCTPPDTGGPCKTHDRLYWLLIERLEGLR